jgi:hypothetical protein
MQREAQTLLMNVTMLKRLSSLRISLKDLIFVSGGKGGATQPPAPKQAPKTPCLTSLSDRVTHGNGD